MKHPFTDEDIDAAAASVLASPTYIKRVARYLWDSAVKRGAVEETYSAPGWKQHVDAYIIKLPEDKT